MIKWGSVKTIMKKQKKSKKISGRKKVKEIDKKRQGKSKKKQNKRA